jgi:hypothetical protein
MCHAICTVTCSTWQRSMFSVSVPEDVDQFTAVVREDDGWCLGESIQNEIAFGNSIFFFDASAWQKILKHTAQHLPPLSPLPSRPHLSSVTTITPRWIGDIMIVRWIHTKKHGVSSATPMSDSTLCDWWLTRKYVQSEVLGFQLSSVNSS